jgi:hypothetical protein
MTSLFLTAAAYFFVYLVFEVLVARVARSLSLLKRVISTFLVFLLIALTFVHSLETSHILFLFLSLAMFWLVYVEVLVCAKNSVSLLLLSRLADSPNGKLEFSELSSQEKQDASVSVRIEAMIASGFLIQSPGNEILLSTSANRIACFIKFFRGIIRGDLNDR